MRANPRSVRYFLCFLVAATTAAWAGKFVAPGTQRPLRYTPVDGGFVIENGEEGFNRPLYAGNTGYRVEAGDRPEFAIYQGGRGGVLRLGLRQKSPQGKKAQWLHQAESIVARYDPGSMVYQIRDSILADGMVELAVVPLAGFEGVALRVRSKPAAPVAPLELIWAYGGANGERGRRDGDLGSESVPISRYFQLQPEHCRGQKFRINPKGFTLPLSVGTVVGSFSGPPNTLVADAAAWNDPSALLGTAGKSTDFPVAAGVIPLDGNRPIFAVIQLVRPGQDPHAGAKDPAGAFAGAEAARLALANRVAVETPDAFVNAAARALCVAADAIWDEKESAYMHGAVSWRMKLLGWRAAYAGDALGWPDRTRRHLLGFAAHQNTSPIPESIPPADEKYHLARSEAALNSNGDFSNSPIPHYNMNLVAIDAFFRHLMWTGDLAMAREMWPVLGRHLARERRLFRREFGPGHLPLYEGYACFWASDEISYNGGGATHATAYNYWHQKMAAKLAARLGHDPSDYEREAVRIAGAMRTLLWMPEKGAFAESKDLLGLQLVHPSAAAWTIYHTIDSRVPNPVEAWQMTREAESRLAQIPLAGPGVPEGTATMATTNWMPYRWSVNNVAMAETAHMALAYWQAGRPDRGFALFKGAILDSMFLGACPGNVGMTTGPDIYSGEHYRDFADAVGISARALVEGLFGIQVDHLENQITIAPGFPEEWDHASIRHPSLDFAFRRDGMADTFTVQSRSRARLALRLELPARLDRVAAVEINGAPVDWQSLPDHVGSPKIRIPAPPGMAWKITVRWSGSPPVSAPPPAVVAAGEIHEFAFPGARVRAVQDPQDALVNEEPGPGRLSTGISSRTGPKTFFVQLEQGGLVWWQPLAMEIRPAVEWLAPAEQSPGKLQFRLQNHSRVSVAGELIASYSGRTFTRNVDIPAGGGVGEIELPAEGLPPGTHRVEIALDGQPLVAGELVNWRLDPAGLPGRWEMLDLSGAFNARVDQIFQQEYRSPRSPFCSLAVPKQGIGGWCGYQDTAVIDDRGLRAAAGSAGVFASPLGIPFRTPGDAGSGNVIFTSRWDRFPAERVLPLGGKAMRAIFLMAGSASHMQSRMDNGEMIITYADGSVSRMALHAPDNWWPIEQDYHIDGQAFDRPGPVPPRLDLLTAKLRIMNPKDCRHRGKRIPGGAATILDLPLDPAKPLQSITIRALANETIIGLMSVTLQRP